MPKLTTINVPHKDGVMTKEGYVANLRVGDVKVKMFLQLDLLRPSVLTHYASGYKLASLAGMALARYVSTGYLEADNLSYWRKLAQMHLDRLVSDKGAENVLAKFASTPTLNH